MTGTLINRASSLVTVEWEAGTAYSKTTLPFGRFSMGSILVPASWAVAGIGFVLEDSFLPCRLEDGAIVEIPVIANDGYYRIPLDLASFSSEGLDNTDMRLWSQTGGAGVNQTLSNPVLVRMKG